MVWKAEVAAKCAQLAIASTGYVSKPKTSSDESYAAAGGLVSKGRSYPHLAFITLFLCYPIGRIQTVILHLIFFEFYI